MEGFGQGPAEGRWGVEQWLNQHEQGNGTAGGGTDTDGGGDSGGGGYNDGPTEDRPPTSGDGPAPSTSSTGESEPVVTNTAQTDQPTQPFDPNVNQSPAEPPNQSVVQPAPVNAPAPEPSPPVGPPDSGIPDHGTSGLDVAKTVKAIDGSAIGTDDYSKATNPNYNKCLTVVEGALAAGGVDISVPSGAAKDAGQALEDAGFVNVTSADYTPRAGDVAVIPPYVGDTRTDKNGGIGLGHVAIYDGTQWVSQTKQSNRTDGRAGGGANPYNPQTRPLTGPVQYYRP